jgi:1-acyl-sn-glycerol-3-phosphate acyltransferase
MLRAVQSLVFWAFLVSSSAALFPVAGAIWLVTLPFDRQKFLLHRFTCFWGSLYTWLNPAWPVSISGREHFDEQVPTVLVANHLSTLDILVLFRLFKHFKWVSKVENFRLPFIGWNMTLNGYVRIERGNCASAVRMFDACEHALTSGSSIMMFPEGTRSSSGQLRSFKPGAFQLALRARRPIIPIALYGTAEALPKRGFVLRGRHPIEVKILEPIPFESFADATVEELSARVRDRIAMALEEGAKSRESARSTP